ncbi:MAG: imidazole glycerol phosphate synthase subunit HisH [Fimbriimonadales bacterium]
MSRSVAIVRTGTANVRSVAEALLRAGFEPQFAAPEDVASAERVVLPGVGSFGAAMATLDAEGFAEPIRDRIRAGKSTLCICLGMQLLAAGSEESPGVRGLGVVDAVVRRLSGEVRVPQMGWNQVDASPDVHLVQSGYAYFANSFGLFEQPPGWAASTVDHGGKFVAAIERGGVLACQFHPELSGAWGQALIERWLRC